MGFTDKKDNFQDLLEIEQDIKDIEFDLKSNANSILARPKEMETKIQNILTLISQTNQKLQFFRKSNLATTPEFFKRVKNLEQKISILQNQVELNLKLLKKV